MRVVAIIANCCLLIVVAIMIIDDWPNELMYQLMVLLLLTAPLTSTVALVQASPTQSENWLALLLQRKKLEEKEKLRKLQQSNNEKA